MVVSKEQLDFLEDEKLLPGTRANLFTYLFLSHLLLHICFGNVCSCELIK